MRITKLVEAWVGASPSYSHVNVGNRTPHMEVGRFHCRFTSWGTRISSPGVFQFVISKFVVSSLLPAVTIVRLQKSPGKWSMFSPTYRSCPYKEMGVDTARTSVAHCRSKPIWDQSQNSLCKSWTNNWGFLYSNPKSHLWQHRHLPNVFCISLD